MIEFLQSHSGALDDIDGFIHLILGVYKGDKPTIITGIEKILLNCDCINGSFVH